MENKVPRTPEEFETYWRVSPEYRKVQSDISAHLEEYPLSDDDEAALARHPSQTQHETLKAFRQAKRSRQAKHARPGSPYIITVRQQVSLNVKRAYQRVWGDKSATVSLHYC